MTDSDSIRFARAVATVGLGMTAGFMSTVSLITIPNLFQVNLSQRDRIALWSKSFDSGKNTMVPMIPLLTALLSTAAYKVQAWNQFTFVGRHRKVILALAAALTFANAPFTALAIIPRVNKLKAIEQSIIKDTASTSVPSQADTDEQIRAWTRLHHVRSVMGVIAFVLSVTELACV